MARQITAKCCGLPFSISLRNKFRRWLQPKSKLSEAHRPIPTKAELCLLLCSMFPEDCSIPIKDLILYGKGLNLFQDVHEMIAAIDRVRDHVEITNAGCWFSVELHLEEDEYGNQYVKTPIGAHRVATLIASRYQLAFGYETIVKKWPHISKYEYCHGLSLALKKIKKHPLSLECPKLELLQLQYRECSQCLPISFFFGMKNLRVLFLDVPSLPYSLGMLRNLRTLRLIVHKLENMSWIGGLINLEFLLVSTTISSDIPPEMGELCNLKLLDLSKMNVAYIPQGVFSRMLKLEELYLPLSFRRWGCKVREEIDDSDERGSSEENGCDYEERRNANLEIDDEERINVGLNEIVSLSLNVLHICFPKASVLPSKSPIFKNIWQFKILVPSNLKYQSFAKGPINELQLTGDACGIKESGICDLMKRTEDLSLIRVKNLKNIMYQLEDYEFPRLKKMIATECDELEHLVDTQGHWILAGSFWELNSLHLSMLPNLKEIWHGKRPIFLWLYNLREINIRFCHKLRYVFPLSMAKGLKQLQSIEILECDEMEGVFYKNKGDDKTNDHTIDWNFIRNLHLHSLPKLTGFLVKKDDTDHGVHGDQLSSEEVTTNQSFKIDGSCCSPSPSSTSPWKMQKNVTQQFISNKQVSLPKEDIINHMEMYSAFSFRLTGKMLEGLEKLKIAFCDTLQVIFSFSENYASSGVLNSLKELELIGLRNLMHVWFQIPSNTTVFQNLQLLVLLECHNLYLFSPQVAKLLVQLQKIQISRCEKMEEIILAEREKEAETIMYDIVFPQLKALELQHMPKLRIFYKGICAIKLPLLESLKLNQCIKMESFSYGSLNTPMLERVHINGCSYSLVGDLNATMKWQRS